MKWLILIFFILSSCKVQRTFEDVEVPTKTEIDNFGRIKPGNGPENAKRMKYYNSLQHKKYYRQKKSDK